MRSPNLRQLRTFRSVMSLGSVTLAADAMKLSQPALSKHIAQLEEAVGLKLFKRHRGGPMIPTAEGLAFYKSIEGALFGLDAIPRLARDIAENKKRRLSIVATPPISNARPFVAVLARLRADHPELQLSLHSRPRIDLESYLVSGQADVAIGLIPSHDPALIETPLVATALHVVTPTGHPLSRHKTIGLNDLAAETLILPCRQLLRDRIDAELGDLRADIETSSTLTSCSLVAAGLGVALCDPFSPTFKEDDQLRSIPLSPEITLQYGALTARPPGDNAYVDALNEDLRAQLEAFALPKPRA